MRSYLTPWYACSTAAFHSSSVIPYLSIRLDEVTPPCVLRLLSVIYCGRMARVRDSSLASRADLGRILELLAIWRYNLSGVPPQLDRWIMIRKVLLEILQAQSLAVARCSPLKAQPTSSSANRRNGRGSSLCGVACNSVANIGRNVQSTKYEQMKLFLFSYLFFLFSLSFFSFFFLFLFSLSFFFLFFLALLSIPQQ
jgi:hypothetical protein